MGCLLRDLLKYRRAAGHSYYWVSDEQELHESEEECSRIVDRLLGNTGLENLDALQSDPDDKDFNLLVASIRRSIEQGEPEAALDRLHTYMMKYVRRLCDEHGVAYDRKHPLQSIFGGYVKALANECAVDSGMTERILKSSISVLDSFNSVRNNQSLAHPNPVLNYRESVLILSHIAGLVRFLDDLEEELRDNKLQESPFG